MEVRSHRMTHPREISDVKFVGASISYTVYQHHDIMTVDRVWTLDSGTLPHLDRELGSKKFLITPQQTADPLYLIIKLCWSVF